MADMLATKEDLASLLERDDILITKAVMLIECATAVVQAVVGQRIVAATSTAVLPAPSGFHLQLPQWPVRSVLSVSIDGGSPDTEWRPDGGLLWRARGWRTRSGWPNDVAVLYEHGNPTGTQGLQLARSSVLSLASGVYDNPTGATRESVDDYTRAYEAMTARMDASPFLVKRLVAEYGMPAVSISLGRHPA